MTLDQPPGTASPGITVANESGVPGDDQSLALLAGFLMPRLGLHPDCELSITLVDVDRMTDLHVQWMDEPGPTDVLSFPMDELRGARPGDEPPLGVLGDIVLCPEFVKAQAAQRGHTLDEELAFLVTHGMLHLIGHDHATQSDYDTMFALQDELLAEWNQR